MSAVHPPPGQIFPKSTTPGFQLIAGRLCSSPARASSWVRLIYASCIIGVVTTLLRPPWYVQRLEESLVESTALLALRLARSRISRIRLRMIGLAFGCFPICDRRKSQRVSGIGHEMMWFVGTLNKEPSPKRQSLLFYDSMLCGLDQLCCIGHSGL